LLQNCGDRQYQQQIRNRCKDAVKPVEKIIGAAAKVTCQCAE
jgi:hypothetical protein